MKIQEMLYIKTGMYLIINKINEVRRLKWGRGVFTASSL